MYSQHSERHFSNHSSWLRAGVSGVNNGLVSTASLPTGVAAAAPSPQTLLPTGVFIPTDDAVSMAVGEHVSVSSQPGTEKAGLHKECYELEVSPDTELEEPTEIHRRHGLSDTPAAEIAQALTEHDTLSTHIRDEIGITETSAAKPMQTALASAGSFRAGAILPLLIVPTAPTTLIPTLAATTLCGLATLGYVSVKLGDTPVVPAVSRICLWGVAVLVVTSLVDKLTGITA